MSEMDKQRIEDIDNMARKSDKRLDDVEEALKEMQGAGLHIEQAIQQLFIQLLAQQIMNEVIPRYLAGYKAGDYIKEVEQASNEAVNDPSKFKMLVSDPNFDEPRFQELCKEIAQVMINMKAQAAKKNRDEQQQKASQVIQMPRPQIIKP